MMAPSSPNGGGGLPMPNATGKGKGKKGNGGLHLGLGSRKTGKKKWWRRNRVWVAALVFIATSATLWM